MMKTALARLRAKTDRELSILVARQLSRSLVLARRQNFRDAARGYHSARGLLAVAELPPAERVRLEALLYELRSHIELPTTAVA